MPEAKNLSHLTRSLMLGVSVGSVTLTQVGCTPEQLAALQGVSPPPGGSPPQGAAQPAAAPQAATQGEQALCNRAVQMRTAADVNNLVTQYPNSRCIVPLLSDLPPATLGSLSASALLGMGEGVHRAIPSAVRAQLPAQYLAGRAFSQREERDDRY